MEKELARAADKLIGFQRTCIEVSLNLPRTLNVSYLPGMTGYSGHGYPFPSWMVEMNEIAFEDGT